METRTLFICTFLGARSLIASEIMRKQVGSGYLVECSGFEVGRMPELLRQTAAEKDIFLPMESPPTIFDRFRAGERFDYVVSLCGEGSKEKCSLLRSCIDVMYGTTATLSAWSIRDFSSVQGTEAEIVMEWRRIIDDIEQHCMEFLDSHQKLAI